MIPMKDSLKKRLARSTALGLVLLGWIAWTAQAIAQDDHAGHDHAAHAGQPHVDSEAEAHAEVADHDEHEADQDHAALQAEADHDDDDNHGDEAVTDEHGDEEEEEGLRLTPEQHKRFGIVLQTAGPGSLKTEISLPGEITFNQDRVAHIVPRVAGIAREVFKSTGDTVTTGELLAVIESRELADAKSEYLAAKARAGLTEKTFAREKALREQKVSSEQDFLEAEQAQAESRIELRSAEQKLHALGLPEADIQALDPEHDAVITRYEIRSPIDGTIIERHISLGESLAADADIFTVADLASVWVDLTVYTKNIGTVRPHQDVTLRVDHSGVQARGEVAMVTPFADASTRSATARVVLDNRDGQWVPGTFATGFISTDVENLPVVVPRGAVQNIEGRDVVFISHKGAYEMQPVTVGRTDRTQVEIVAGLQPGTSYVTDGAYQLKATVITSDLDSHAGHGH